MNSVIHQNFQTVAFLQKRDFSNALQSTVSTMLLLRQQDHTSDSNTGDGIDQCMLHFDEAAGSRSNIDNSRNDGVFVYDHGILLPSTMLLTPDQYSTVLHAIAIFNSALAHQLYAQHEADKDTSHRYLLKSRRLYELVLQDWISDENLLFKFVAINNIIAIDFLTGNVEHSALYMDHLKSMYWLMVDRGCISRLSRLSGFFRRNLQISNTAAAA